MATTMTTSSHTHQGGALHPQHPASFHLDICLIDTGLWTSEDKADDILLFGGLSAVVVVLVAGKSGCFGLGSFGGEADDILLLLGVT